MKRSLALTMAAGLLASLALATPSQAGSVLITTDLYFDITKPVGDLGTQWTLTYTGNVPVNPPPLNSSYTILPTTTLSGVSLSGSGQTVTATFTPKSSGELDFTFISTAAGLDPNSVALSSFFIALSPVKKALLSVSVDAVSVPEPASMGLLGIGVTGFFAFRRIFKQTVVA